MATGNIIFSTSSTTIIAGDAIEASDFERSVKLQVDDVSGNINITGGINTGNVSNLGSNANVKISGGTSGQTIVTDGSGNLSWGSSYAGPAGQAFTSNDIFTIPTGITRLKVTVVGGGGGGGQGYGGGCCISLPGVGGGGGGAAIKWLTGLTPGNTLTVTVGGGGAGELSVPPYTIAQSGGTTSVSSGTQSITTISASGGTRGYINSPGPGGSTFAGADITFPGANGGGSGSISFGGAGGGSLLGTANNYTASAKNGNNYGGGGAGYGGNGAGGIVIFEW